MGPKKYKTIEEKRAAKNAKQLRYRHKKDLSIRYSSSLSSSQPACSSIDTQSALLPSIESSSNNRDELEQVQITNSTRFDREPIATRSRTRSVRSTISTSPPILYQQSTPDSSQIDSKSPRIPKTIDKESTSTHSRLVPISSSIRRRPSTPPQDSLARPRPVPPPTPEATQKPSSTFPRLISEFSASPSDSLQQPGTTRRQTASISPPSRIPIPISPIQQSPRPATPKSTTPPPVDISIYKPRRTIQSFPIRTLQQPSTSLQPVSSVFDTRSIAFPTSSLQNPTSLDTLQTTVPLTSEKVSYSKYDRIATDSSTN